MLCINYNNSLYALALEINSGRMNQYLKFKNFLIQNSALTKEYENLRTKLSEKYADDRKIYTKRKEQFIERILHS